MVILKSVKLKILDFGWVLSVLQRQCSETCYELSCPIWGSFEFVRFSATLNTKILAPARYYLSNKNQEFPQYDFKETLSHSVVRKAFRQMVLVIKAPRTTRRHHVQVCRGCIVISAVCGCQQESGIMDYNHFAQSKDRSSRKTLILADGSCRVRKGRNTNKEMEKKGTDDDMLVSKSKLSRFAETNRTITSACRAMKNTKGQEHQSEMGKKVVTTTERDKSKYPNPASTLLPAKHCYPSDQI